MKKFVAKKFIVKNDSFVNLAIFFLLAFKQELCLCLIMHTQANQLVPQLLMKQSDTLYTQYRHIEHLHEVVWCQNINYWQNDSFVNIAICFLLAFKEGLGYACA